ncbi:hypothetical protein FRB94_010159 [Tulasnella sp. JGI-2019a]|nr:hypothetical protein FRB94_010159 [Tulasnella sp. JGI-2019a]
MAGSSYVPLSQTEENPLVTAGESSSHHMPLTDVQAIRPPTYYGEGQFSPPSSTAGDDTEVEDDDDEGEGEKERMLEKRRDMLRGRNTTDVDLEDVHPDYLPPYDGRNGLVVGGSLKTRSPLRYLIYCLLGLVGLASVIGVLAAWSYNGTAFRALSLKPLTMDSVFDGTFSADRRSLLWVPEAGDGIFSSSDGGNIVLHDLRTNSSRTLVERNKVRNEHGATLYWSSWKLSADMKYLLIATDRKKQWRHSSFSNYYIYDLETETTVALAPPTSPPVVSYATWSPTGESIAYVSSNDLYIVVSPKTVAEPIRVTSTGNSSLFHGVPDWVYEEEVFEGDFSLWWSPDSKKVAFLTLDETKVDTYTYPVYNRASDSFAVQPYTNFITMKYPKPGYANPLASVHLFELDKYMEANKSANATVPAVNVTIELVWDGRQPVEDSVIMEVAWVANASLIVKEVNRSANNGSVILFDLDHTSFVGGKGRAVRKLGKTGEQGDDGWIDPARTVRAVPTKPGEPASYLDIIPTKDGYNHIALFSPADSTTPHWLTSGEWEVVDGIKAVDRERGLVYFVSTQTSSIERHIYSVPLPSSLSVLPIPPKAPTPLTDNTQPAWFTVNFSPQAGYYSLGYEGPNVPWQKVMSVDNSTFTYPLTNNKHLNATIAQYQAPIISRMTIESDGYELNAMEIRPNGMDDSGRKKYPVLFRVYGGPNSQMVHTRFEKDWHHYLACSLKYIIVVVDARGTGAKGRKLRNPVSRNLGYFETKDQIEAARIWATKRYVDTKRIGIWGWSYGGFMAAKVLEANAGIHSLAMSVAPVTSWRLYDSIYTERYMGLPKDNPKGYVNASVSTVDGFRDANFLLAHGSGDDNVHFANSAHLLDMLTQEKVRGFSFRMFTDSDHGISRRGAYRELHEWMTSFLLENWGKGGVRRGG